MFDSVEQLERRLASIDNRADRIIVLLDLGYALLHSDSSRSRELIGEALAQAESMGDDPILGRALRASASFDLHAGAYDQASQTLQRSFTLAEDSGDRPAEAHTLRIMGHVYKSLGESMRALLYQLRALEIYQDLGDREGEGGVRNDIGNCYKSLGDFSMALEHQLVSLDIAVEQANRIGEASALNNIGNIYYELRDLHRALEFYTRSLAIKETLGDPRALGNSYGNIGLVHGALDDPERAIEFHTRSLDYFRRCGDLQGESNSLCNLATVWCDRANGELALQYGYESLAIARQIGDREGESVSLRGIGAAQVILGNLDGAIENFREALHIASDLGVRPLELLIHSSLYRATRTAGYPEVAFAHLSEACRTREKISSSDAQQIIHNQQLLHELENTRKESEIERLKNVELAAALDDLHAAQVRLVQAEKMAYIGHLTSGVTEQARHPIASIEATLPAVGTAVRQISAIALECLTTIALRSMEPSELSRKIAGRPVGELFESIGEGLTIIEQAALEMASVVEGLRSFARLDEGSLKLADLHDGINPLLTLVSNRCGERITIDFRPGGIPLVECYPGLINQAVLAIVSEGIETIQGKGEISIRTEPRHEVVALVIERRSEPGESNGSEREGENRLPETPAVTLVREIIEKHGGELQVVASGSSDLDISLLLPVRQRRAVAQSSPTSISVSDAPEERV